MSFENPLTFVRSLKGAPASVFLAFLFVRRPMTNRELQRWTGYSEESIAQATHLLMDLGWISPLGPRGPWTVSAERQLPLTDSLPAETPGAGSAPALGTEPVLLESDQKGDELEDREDENFVTALYALYDAGVREPTAGRLARMRHVTPEYITAHVEQANAQGFGLGMAVYRMEHAWPLTEEKAVLTVEDRIRKFIEGQ